MNNSDSKGERSIALFLLGILLFNPPLLSIFGVDVAFGGIPLLYIYLFLAWAVFIVLIGLISEVGQERRRNLRVPTLPSDQNAIGHNAIGQNAIGKSAIPRGSLPHSITPHSITPSKAPSRGDQILGDGADESGDR